MGNRPAITSARFVWPRRWLSPHPAPDQWTPPRRDGQSHRQSLRDYVTAALRPALPNSPPTPVNSGQPARQAPDKSGCSIRYNSHDMLRLTYLLGDHHGDYAGLFRILDEQSIRDAVVIHVGDGHEGFPECGQPVLERLNQEFATRGIEYLSIRGNHCNPVFFEGNHLLSNLKLLPDYTRLELNGEAWLFVGGAVSVNRIDKIQCGEWWSREGSRLDPSKVGPADVLVTHSGPTWIGPGCASPLVQAYARAEEDFGNSSLIADLNEERRQHDQLFRLVKPRTWHLGHFHQKAEKQNAGCRTRILDCGELIRHSVG